MTPIGWLKAAFPVRLSCSLQGSLCLLHGEKVGEDKRCEKESRFCVLCPAFLPFAS